MKASYSVVRFVPDPVRDEPRNVGILLWTEADFTIRLDTRALRRAEAESPTTASAGLADLSSFIESLVAPDGTFIESLLLRVVAGGSTTPITFSTPRSAVVGSTVGQTLPELIEFLIGRLVRPPRQRRSRGSGRPRAALANRVRPLIRNRMVELDHQLERSKSGVQRTVDFFVATGSGFALDVLNLAVADDTEVLKRADAAAFKIEDILAELPSLDVAVCCFDGSPHRPRAATENAARVLGSAGALVLDEVDIAADSLLAAAGVTTTRRGRTEPHGSG